MRRQRRARASSQSGFSLVEMLIAMAIGTMVMGATLTALSNALRANDAVHRLSGMNNTLRSAMDLMVRDFLQVGSGLPPGHVVQTPSGSGSTLVRIPGPPGTAFTNPAGATNIAAIIPGSGRGPVVNGVATDTITVLMADNTFLDISVSATTSTTITVPASVNIAAGPDRVVAGQLMMITKGSVTTLVEVTAVNTSSRVLTFATGDSLNLNQTTAAQGTLAQLNAATPANSTTTMRISRVRMISYYIDATTAGRPRLVRRINNGHPTTFNNTLGTMVGNDVEGLRISYDLADGVNNPSDVRFLTADLSGSGACSPNACAASQIRKINVSLTARAGNAAEAGGRVFRNTLTSQVSLRSMAFVNEYQSP